MVGIILGVVHLSRLDKCRLMSGFENWDTGKYTLFLISLMSYALIMVKYYLKNVGYVMYR